MKKIRLVLLTVFVMAAFLLPVHSLKAFAAPTDNGEATVNAYSGWPMVSPSVLSNLEITYDLGDGKKYVLTGEIAKAVLVNNEDGTLYVDPATGNYVINPYNENAFIVNIGSLLTNRAPSSLNFTATDGRQIAFDGHTTTGTRIAVQQECDYLTNAMVNGLRDTHTPAVVDMYDIGDTYVEIDMTNQMLYYYQNGVLMLTTPIVTGCISAGHPTPTGIYVVNNKQRDQVLKGEDYESFVNYWCPVIRNSIGIHDATWRSKFGGSIYKTNGSHGCINVPLKNMALLYPILSVGTPVVMFY